MTKDDEPPDQVECCVCGKKINVTVKQKVKKVNGSGRTAISKARPLRDGRWVCSDVCFNMAVNPYTEP